MVMALCARFETILVLSAIVLVRSMKGDAFILGPEIARASGLVHLQRQYLVEQPAMCRIERLYLIQCPR
jgi:hypothetical protein